MLRFARPPRPQRRPQSKQMLRFARPPKPPNINPEHRERPSNKQQPSECISGTYIWHVDLAFIPGMYIWRLYLAFVHMETHGTVTTNLGTKKWQESGFISAVPRSNPSPGLKQRRPAKGSKRPSNSTKKLAFLIVFWNQNRGPKLVSENRALLLYFIRRA